MKYKYFVYDPGNDGFETFETPEKAMEFAKICIESYKEDEWGGDVEHVVCGEITHEAGRTNIQKRPRTDAVCARDNYWPLDYDEMCDYEMVEVEKKGGGRKAPQD